jgi:hypothetical protein
MVHPPVDTTRDGWTQEKSTDWSRCRWFAFLKPLQLIFREALVEIAAIMIGRFSEPVGRKVAPWRNTRHGRWFRSPRRPAHSVTCSC